MTKNDSTILIKSGRNDTISLHYLEDNKWTNGYSICQFEGIDDSITGLRIDNVYGYNILRKEK